MYSIYLFRKRHPNLIKLTFRRYGMKHPYYGRIYIICTWIMASIQVKVCVMLIKFGKRTIWKCSLGRPEVNGKIKLDIWKIASDDDKLMPMTVKLFCFPQNLWLSFYSLLVFSPASDFQILGVCLMGKKISHQIL